MYRYKINIIEEMTKKGFSPSRIRKERLISECTMTNIRKKKAIGMDTLNTICCILRCQPSDVIEIVPNDEEKIKFY